MTKLSKAHQALIGAWRVLCKPIYLIIALAITFLFATLIYIIINGGFYSPLLVSKLSAMEKIGVLGAAIGEMTASIPESANGVLLITVSLLQGISLSVTIYAMVRNRRDHKVTPTRIGLNGFAAIAAIIGLGCVPCGTSLILPIIMIFFSGSAVALTANIASGIVLAVALLLSIYSIYKTGNIAYMHSEFENQSSKIAKGYDEQK